LKAANSGGARYKRKHCKNAETVVMREKGWKKTSI
jgi:hypothetical protein